MSSSSSSHSTSSSPHYMIYDHEGKQIPSAIYYVNLSLDTYNKRLEQIRQIYHIQDQQIAKDCVFSNGVFSQVKNGEYGVSAKSENTYRTKAMYEEIFRQLFYFYDIWLVMELNKFVNQHHLQFRNDTNGNGVVNQLAKILKSTNEQTYITLRSWVKLELPLLNRKAIDIALRSLKNPQSGVHFGDNLSCPRFKFQHPCMQSTKQNHLNDNLIEFRATLEPWSSNEWKKYFLARGWIVEIKDISIHVTCN